MSTGQASHRDTGMPADTARALWAVLEPYHAVTYFEPEARAATDTVGLVGGWMGYFASRAAPLGPVPAEVVIAAFHNFHPAMIRRAIPDAWNRATPAAILNARLRGADAALRRLLGDELGTETTAEAAGLAREAAEACELEGRPLFAANAALPWPEEPHLALWTAATRLREHRFDGHVAALLVADIGPCEAHVLLAGAGAIDAVRQRRFRGWTEADWAAATDRLERREWCTPEGALTDAGKRGRAEIERATDHLALRPWRTLGSERTERLWTLMRHISGLVVSGGAMPTPNPIGLTWPPPMPNPRPDDAARPGRSTTAEP